MPAFSERTHFSRRMKKTLHPSGDDFFFNFSDSQKSGTSIHPLASRFFFFLQTKRAERITAVATNVPLKSLGASLDYMISGMGVEPKKKTTIKKPRGGTHHWRRSGVQGGGFRLVCVILYDMCVCVPEGFFNSDTSGHVEELHDFY